MGCDDLGKKLIRLIFAKHPFDRIRELKKKIGCRHIGAAVSNRLLETRTIAVFIVATN